MASANIHLLPTVVSSMSTNIEHIYNCLPESRSSEQYMFSVQLENCALTTALVTGLCRLVVLSANKQKTTDSNLCGKMDAACVRPFLLQR